MNLNKIIDHIDPMKVTFLIEFLLLQWGSDYNHLNPVPTKEEWGEEKEGDGRGLKESIQKNIFKKVRRWGKKKKRTVKSV